MKPAAFEYLQPRSRAEAIATLARYGGEAKLLAGGQSLVPLLNFRLLRPAALIDINRVSGLDHVDWRADAGLRIGALTRHHALEVSPIVARHFPVVSAAMAHVAHLAIRNRDNVCWERAASSSSVPQPLVVSYTYALPVGAGSGSRYRTQCSRV